MVHQIARVPSVILVSSRPLPSIKLELLLHTMPRNPDAKRFKKILKDARKKAKTSHSYSSAKTRADLVSTFELARPGKTPYPWQIDISEALILGLDCLLVAGTGAGLTVTWISASRCYCNTIHFYGQYKAFCYRTDHVSRLPIFAIECHQTFWGTPLQLCFRSPMTRSVIDRYCLTGSPEGLVYETTMGG